MRKIIKRILLKIIGRKTIFGSTVRLSISGKEPPLLIEKTADLKDIFIHIQKVWEYYGKEEPYWSVISSENFKLGNINESREDFYKSGSDNVDTLLKSLERNGVDTSSLKTCLEYGCGLGRVTFWLATKFDKVLAYDISKTHLELARKYYEKAGNGNITFFQIDRPQDIGNFPKVDLVYSVIVLQHNPPPVIILIIQELLRALNPGGIAFLQVPTYRLGYQFVVKEYLEKDLNETRVEMHFLPQNEIFEIVNNENGKILEVLEDDWIGLNPGDRSNTFIIQKVANN